MMHVAERSNNTDDWIKLMQTSRLDNANGTMKRLTAIQDNVCKLHDNNITLSGYVLIVCTEQIRYIKFADLFEVFNRMGFGEQVGKVVEPGSHTTLKWP